MKQLSLLLVVLFIGCSRPSSSETANSSARPNVDDLAEKMLVYLIVEHEPDEYPPTVRQKIKGSLSDLEKSFKQCSPEELTQLESKLGRFFEYEASQYDDISQWYTKLTEEVASRDADLLARMTTAKVIRGQTRVLAAKLPDRIRKFAKDQMKGAELGSAQLWDAIPQGGSLTLSAVQAGQAAAAKYNANRKQSYSHSYRQITGKDLSTR